MPATELAVDIFVRFLAVVAAGLAGTLLIPSIRLRFGWVPVVVLVVLARPAVLGGPTSFVFVSGVSMEPTMHTGDLAVLLQQSDYAIGDIVAYHPSQAEDGLIIHRIVGGDAASGFVIRGDNRSTNDFDRPKPAALLGRTLVVFPSVGWFFAGLRMPMLLGLFVALVAMWVTWDLLPEPKKEEGLT